MPLRPAAHAETVLIDGILNGRFPKGSDLPAERSLAEEIGVTRPTLREALQRLERDGWVSIQHGKPTRVKDIFVDGGLGVLGALVERGAALPDRFVEQLLQVRLVMAPAYTKTAIEEAPEDVASLLRSGSDLLDEPAAFAAFDWALHAGLTLLSGNVVYRLILNGFTGFYEEIARLYFATAESRAVSRAFYSELLVAAESRDAHLGEKITRETMEKSLAFWRLKSQNERTEEKS